MEIKYLTSDTKLGIPELLTCQVCFNTTCTTIRIRIAKVKKRFIYHQSPDYYGYLVKDCIFDALSRRSAGVVEPARLESVYTRKGIKGSNPFSSADLCSSRKGAVFVFTQSELVHVSVKIKTAYEQRE